MVVGFLRAPELTVFHQPLLTIVLGSRSLKGRDRGPLLFDLCKVENAHAEVTSGHSY